MMKKTKRKAFNFLRSYFDVLNELETDKDKLAFLMAVINKQFLDEEPELKGMVKFAYISQQHAIEKSVKGWKDAVNQELTDAPANPLPHPPKGSPQNPPQQEKEKEQEKEKGATANPLLVWLGDNCQNVQKMKQPITDVEANKLIQEFTTAAIKEVFEAMDNKPDLRKKYVSAYKTFRSWLKIRQKDNPKYGLRLEKKNKYIDQINLG